MAHGIWLIVLILLSAPAHALSSAERELLPQLQAALDQHWPDAAYRDTVAAQIKSEIAWKISAHNRVRRDGKLIEWGCGLSQVTQVPGRFDALREATRMDPALRGWTWDDCTHIGRQLAYLAIRGRNDTRHWSKLTATPFDARAFAVAAYNRGAGNIAKEQSKCKMLADCDHTRWFGHTETQSATKRGAKLTGYKSDSWTINRNYVTKVMRTWRSLYTIIMGYPDATS
jgi:hypothetical protein